MRFKEIEEKEDKLELKFKQLKKKKESEIEGSDDPWF